MLYCLSLHQCNECIPCQSYYKITPLSTIQWTGRKVCTDCQEFTLQGKKEGKDLFKCLMIYHNTPLSGSLQSPMKILLSRSARSDIDSNLILQSERLRNVNKNAHFPSHDLHIGQEVMYQDATSKWW